MADQVQRALIVGAGIAGLSTAIALRQLDVDVAVLERSEQVRATGGGIHLWHNAMSAYARLGIEEEVAAAGAVMQEAQFRTHHDRLLGRWPLHELDEVHDTVTVGIARSDLLDVLRSHLPDGVITTSAEVTGVEEDDRQVTVTLADGRTVTGDVLIGADGIRSTVREAILGPVETRYAGYAIWQGTLPEFPTERARVGEFRLYYGPGRRFAWYHIGGQRLYWFALAEAPEADEDVVDPRGRLAEMFAGWPDPVPDLPEATPSDDIQRFAMRDRVPDQVWSTDRVTLVGDAAHAMTFNTGQGACQGIEDAVVLMSCLQREPPPAALQRYQALRAPRTTGYVNRSWQLGRIARWHNPVAVAFRTAVMGIVLRTVAWRQHKAQMTFET